MTSNSGNDNKKITLILDIGKFQKCEEEKSLILI